VASFHCGLRMEICVALITTPTLYRENVEMQVFDTLFMSGIFNLRT
jgi:hypothetical protein